MQQVLLQWPSYINMCLAGIMLSEAIFHYIGTRYTNVHEHYIQEMKECAHEALLSEVNELYNKYPTTREVLRYITNVKLDK
jgi:hypothetical protein